MSFHRVVAEFPLVALTLWLQSAGAAALVAWVRRALSRALRKLDTFQLAASVARLAMAVVVLHALEILLWAGFYRWRCLPSWDSAINFSTCSYSTLGCNNVSLPSEWRAHGPLETVIGVLTCGISVSLFSRLSRALSSARSVPHPKNRKLTLPFSIHSEDICHVETPRNDRDQTPDGRGDRKCDSLSRSRFAH
jgi:voltage-gated potassium channel